MKGRDPVDAASELYDQACAAQASRDYRRAAALCRRSVRMLEKALGPQHPDLANVLNTLGAIYEDRAEYKEV